ncbi:OmpA family protein [Methylomonas sp. LL1]|uniref:OmpA family protein n=1 Tax=Methylomonas sp. LL1 TaxID=2785785 RepID=UPI0018C3BF86|nr:OmpA family protein [Methylomonas sp. LL1]QPK63702.1 OmpA family protein [Methylomonas sp. LL1]
MGFQQRNSLFIVPLLLLLSNAQAQQHEENFGKSTPSQEQIIDLFKSGEADSEVTPGVKTRGLNIIDSGKSKPKHKPVTPAMEEKAISMEILFDYNSATLTAEAKQQLGPVGMALASDDLKGLNFRIEGHTDAIGSDQYNIDLSRQRAEAVKQFLTEQYGLAGVSIEIVGKGKNDLADKDNPTSEANRRVRIVRLGK